MSTSSFQNKTSALFASVSRATISSSSKIYTNASAMNSLNNNNNNNNNIINSSPAATMATSSNSGGSSSSGFAKGLSLFASIGGGGGGVGGNCHQLSQQQVNNGSAAAAATATALNNNNNVNNNNNNHSTIYNNNQSDSGLAGSDNVVLSGNLRKLKTMKKKFFVLYRNAPNRPARLEYFDSEKKYRLHASHPKRSIRLEACFNINRRTDTKHKCVIALYTNEDCFCLVCDNEQELELWLHKMLSLQNNRDDENGEPPKPAFAHVWSVEVQRRGLAQDKGLIGRYHLCLTDKSITLNRYGQATSNGESRVASVEFPMSTVRKGGHLNCVFYMELGRQNVLGAGELWLEAQDATTAQTIHHSIINASAKPSRPRSQSASQASKPIILRRQQAQGTTQGIAPMNFSPSSGSSALSGMTGIPENSPNSRPASPNFSTCSSTASTVIPNNYKRLVPPGGCGAEHSCSADYIECCSSAMAAADSHHGSNGVDLCSGGGDQAAAVTPGNGGGGGAVMMVQAAVIIGPKDANINYAGMAIKRERCDSLPSRNRTISDSGNASSLTTSSSTIMPPPKTIPSWNRPVSMCNRPSNSPISPSICSESDGSSISIDEPDGLPTQYTSSTTPDDNGGFFHRYAGPQDSAILEEGDEYWNSDKFHKRVPGPSRPPAATAASLSLPIAGAGSSCGIAGLKGMHRMNGGVDIAGSSSPAIHSSSAEGHNSNYMDMYSPSGSSPMDPNGSYMPMSPSVDVPRSLYTGSSSTHSRASSLTEENLDIGSRYVDMDMSHNQSHASQNRRLHGGGGLGEGGLSSAASSSSITSGTPSTDTRFADYPLEKVYSTFGPDDDENNPLSERPMRAYSVGSRLEHSKRKFRMDHSLSSSLASNSSASSRTRAYSVGSRAKMPRSDQYKSSFVGSPAQIALFNSVQHSQYQTGSMMTVMMPPLSDANNNSNKVANTNNKKSSSVPMLDSFGPGGESAAASDVPLERVTDFMELDFSSVSIGKISESEDYVLSDNLTPLSQPSLEHDYLNMEPVGSKASAGKVANPEGYVEMRPVGSGAGSPSVTISPARQKQQQQLQHPNSSSSASSSSSSNTSNLTSNVINCNNSSSNSNNTPKMSSSQKSASMLMHEESDYLDMRGKDVSGIASLAIKKVVVVAALAVSNSGSNNNNEDYLNMAPLNRDLRNGGGPVADVCMPSAAATPASSHNVMTSSAEEGYLEMSFSRSNSISAASSAEFNAQQETYIKARKPMTSNRSLPININYNSNAATVPAPGMVPITPRNNVGGLFSKLSSLEEVHSPIQATTPSNGKKSTPTTMFPFSPASPAGGEGGGVGGARGKFQHQISQLSSGSPMSSIGGAIGVGEMVQARKILVDGTTGTLKLSESEQSLPRRKISTADESLDYVNYEPESVQRRDSNRSMGSTHSNGTAADDEMQGDYVLMNPVVGGGKGRRKSAGQPSPKGVIVTGGFRPIPCSADKELLDGQAAQRSLLLNRQLSLNTVSETQRMADESPYELLRTTSGGSGSDLSAMLRGPGRKSLSSRPSSVNSDKITSRISNLSLNRPNSANSDRLSTISSSSSSTSTLCGNSSSSSSTATLCGATVASKVHSPMLMNRVPSDPSSNAVVEDNSAALKSLPKIGTASSMDKELHYASLDLPPCSVVSTTSSPVSLAPLAKPEVDFASSSAGLAKSCRNSADSSAASSATNTPSPSVLMGAGGSAAAGAPLPAFNYAQLDFAKCEAMKQQQ